MARPRAPAYCPEDALRGLLAAAKAEQTQPDGLASGFVSDFVWKKNSIPVEKALGRGA